MIHLHTFIIFTTAVVTRADVSITSKVTSEIKNVVDLMNISLPYIYINADKHEYVPLVV